MVKGKLEASENFGGVVKEHAVVVFDELHNLVSPRLAASGESMRHTANVGTAVSAGVTESIWVRLSGCDMEYPGMHCEHR